MLVVSVLELVAGAGIIGLWTMLLLRRQIPEIEAGDIAIWFHIVAEYLIGVALVVGGLLLLLGDDAPTRVFAGAAAGGMVYSTINSPGYYAREGQWGLVAGFGVLTLLGVVAILLLIFF